MSFLGLPADPAWANHILQIVEERRRIEELDGIGCQPILVSARPKRCLSGLDRVLNLGRSRFQTTMARSFGHDTHLLHCLTKPKSGFV